MLSTISSLGGNADNGSNAANTDTSNAGSGPAQSGDNNADSNSLSELNEFLSILNGDDSGNKHSDGKSDGKNLAAQQKILEMIIRIKHQSLTMENAYIR